jgi:hypothetical protein
VAQNFQIRKKQNKIAHGISKCNSKSFIWKRCTRRIDVWEKYDIIPQNGDCSRESKVSTLVFRNKVRYQNATSLQKIHLQLMLSTNAGEHLEGN